MSNSRESIADPAPPDGNVRSPGDKYALAVGPSAIDASKSTHALRFTNHSCRPNAVLRIVNGRIELYALRELTAGEEITIDYGETHHEGRLRCRCGAPDCIGRL